ncbi:MAG: tRNA uridine(34) 5-carboxymethylaminomethyl modification radical SAM/GNAT enzyme Elp3 [Caldilineales bacterium]
MRHDFDPFEQTASRLTALANTGHPARKIELIILGATWSAYPRPYQQWFVQRCLDAMNGVASGSLVEAQTLNERADVRCVGMTVETRPDWVTLDEALWLRKLGVTRVQLGIQSLDDHILAINRRGHDVAAARHASRLLRAAGFKLLMHWMPNLLGATPESDRQDYLRLWSDSDIRPDELKLYPCSLIAGTGLYDIWQQGGFQPYDHETLVDLLADCKAATPRYCRLDRVIRDIPSTYVVVGNQHANLREMAKARLRASDRRCQCIRCREVRSKSVSLQDLRPAVLTYRAGGGQEMFLSQETGQGQLAGFLRLHLPSAPSAVEAPTELAGCAIIRQLHVYGPSLPIGDASDGEAQHRGIGQGLLITAADAARQAGLQRLAVIASIGTREYYRQNGFQTGDLYMTRDL